MITQAQFDKAKAFRPGMVNLDHLVSACNATGFPWFLALAILEKESMGRNVYGHDVGGALAGFNSDVTESNYEVFRWLVDVKKMKSNGVGPMQLTYTGFLVGPVSIASKGLKPWLAADTIMYAVRDVLLPQFVVSRRTLADQQAFTATARAYNTGSTTAAGTDPYAVDALAKAKVWATTVGTTDTLIKWDVTA